VGLRSLVFLMSFQEKKVTGAVEESVLLSLMLYCTRRRVQLTDEQEGVVDEEVTDGPRREARVAVAEDDHDHPCSSEVCLRRELVVSKIDGCCLRRLTEYGWNQPLYGKVFLSRPCALQAR
jgi:hypothetical protein